MSGEENPARRANAATGEATQGGAGEVIVPPAAASLNPTPDPLLTDATRTLEIAAVRLTRAKLDAERLIREADHYALFERCAKPDEIRKWITSLTMIEERVEAALDEIDRLGMEFAARCSS